MIENQTEELARSRAAAVASETGAVPLNFDFMRGRLAHWIALGLGAGLSPKAPGTIGTALAWLLFTVGAPIFGLDQAGKPWAVGLVFLLGCFVLGVWASYKTANRLGRSDPGAIVVDEIVAFWLILWLYSPSSFTQQCWAFLLFRFFDSVKFGPVAWADQYFKDAEGWRAGLGIMWDDLVAALLTLLVLALFV